MENMQNGRVNNATNRTDTELRAQGNGKLRPNRLLLEQQQNKIKLIRAPDFFIARPLKDFDASGGDRAAPDTFLIISRRGRSGPDQCYRFNGTRSLWLMGPFNPLRLAVIRLITHQYFEAFSILIIMTNCIFLAMVDPPELAEYIFSAIYTSEMFLKIVARGFALHTYAYLRDPWNMLDFLVVILGYVTLAPNIANFSGIRTIRVLRALRTISALKGLKAMVNTLLRSMMMLSDVLILFIFFLAVMALIGLQLFAGELRHKCVLNMPQNLSVSYQEYVLNESFWYQPDGEPLICGNSSTAQQCPKNYTCLPHIGGNPDYGYTNFDNIGWALVLAFQLLTMDFWENVFNKILASSGAWYVFYFVIAIFFCSFYLLNLVLAVVSLSYEQELTSASHEYVRNKMSKRKDTSYSVDEETLEHLIPLERKLEVQLKALKAIKRQRRALLVIQALKKREQQPTLFQRLGSKNTFKDVLEEKIKYESLHKNPYEKAWQTRWRQFQHFMCSAMAHPIFETIIMAFIILNTAVLAVYHHGIDPVLSKYLDNMNLFFTITFVLEMILKLLALGPVFYIQSKWNLFDGVIVIVSVIDTLMEFTNVSDNKSGTSVFRTFRLFRVIKLAQSWSTMGKLLSTIANSVGQLGNVTLILVLVIYMLAVVGVKVFGKMYTPEAFGEDGVPRWNFKDFPHAFMMVFRILCGEWIEPLWDCMRVTNPASILFFVPAFVIGNFIILNLFLALLLNAFDNSDEEEGNDDEEDDSLMSRVRGCFGLLSQTNKTNFRVSIVKAGASVYELQVLQSSSGASKDDRSLDNNNSEYAQMQLGVGIGPDRKTYSVDVDSCLPTCCQLPSCSCGGFYWMKFRCRVRQFVGLQWFEWFILFIVLVSSFMLIFEDVHLEKNPRLADILNKLNYFFVGIFTLEFVLKIIGYGCVRYFASMWNCLDSFIVATSLACLVEDKDLAIFRSLRTVRALRPLRAISRLEGMKVVVNALFAAIPGIANVLLVSLLFWLIFSILGVQLFAGQFYKCIDNDWNRIEASIVPNKTACLNHSDGYRWVNAKLNFDDVINGFVSLFQVATFEGWMEVMVDAVDAAGVDLQPESEKNFSSYIFFVLFIIIGAFFVLNLFVGVIIDNFNSLKRKYDELSDIGMLLTDDQRQWVNILKDAVKKPPENLSIPVSPCRRALFHFVTSSKFEFTIMAVIVLNMFVMMIKHDGQAEGVDYALNILYDICNYIFTSIFLLEAVIRFIAQGKNYLKKYWNIFDLVIVATAVLGIVLDEMSKENSLVNPSLLRVMRVFRIARLLRVLKFAKGIRQLLVALLISLPSLFNVGMLLLLVIFVFAIIGMSTFSRVKKQGNIDDIVNFETFGNSMMLLFRLSTAAGWNDVLDSLMLEPPDCDPEYKGYYNGNCGYPVGAVFYLVCYITIVFLIIVNMYIAIILENVVRAQQGDNFIISKEHFTMYYKLWSEFVPDGKQFLPLADLSNFCDRLDEPLKIPKACSSQLVKLKIPVRSGNHIHCFDLLKTLVKRALENHGESPEAFEVIAVRMEAQFKRSFKVRTNSNVSIRSSNETKSKTDLAAIVLQRAFRSYLIRRENRQGLDNTLYRQAPLGIPDLSRDVSVRRQYARSSRHTDTYELNHSRVNASGRSRADSWLSNGSARSQNSRSQTVSSYSDTSHGRRCCKHGVQYSHQGRTQTSSKSTAKRGAPKPVRNSTSKTEIPTRACDSPNYV